MQLNTLPTGGTIRIQCQIQNAEKDGEVIIKVIDSGSGIDEKSLPFVFDRFFKGTQSQKVGGTGLVFSHCQANNH